MEARPAITITQQDVPELQPAKGAMRAGTQLLLEAMGRTEEELEVNRFFMLLSRFCAIT